MQIFEAFYAFVLLFFFTQGIINLMLSLYAWEDPDRIDEVSSPSSFMAPKTSFSVLVPARNESEVIGETIRNICRANYPKELLEVIVICDDSDLRTIGAALHGIAIYNLTNAKVVSYNSKPINKPHGLNVGLRHATKVSTVIFDAEDSVNPDIFNIANTLFHTKDADVIQAGVQLMNYDSRWFSSHNVLEYYFWFRSRMHFHTKIGMVPLGGNTVFFITEQLRMIGGWDQKCLTEDAEVGVRLSVLGAKVVSTYDPRHITKEETPLTVKDFIKQRTRWNQGFLQVLRKGEWRQYDSTFKRFFCFYVLSFPYTQVFMLVVTVASIAMGIELNVPVLISLFSYAPLLVIFAQISINCLGLHEFAQEQNIKLKWRTLALMVCTFFVYQALLSVSAVRATYRQFTRQHEWEKTRHIGQHRLQPILVTDKSGSAV